MEELFKGIFKLISNSNLTLYYLGFMAAGMISSTLMFFLGGLSGDGSDGGGDHAASGGDGSNGHGNGNGGHGQVHVSFFSPLFLSSFMLSIGAIGIITLHGLRMSPRVSITSSFLLALMFAYGVSYAIISFFIKSQASGVIDSNKLVGTHAEVLTTVSSNSPGQIAYMTQSGRQTRLAKTEDQDEISHGNNVEIVKMLGDIAIVKLIK